MLTGCDGVRWSATARSWKGCVRNGLFAQGLACEKRSERVGISVFDLARGPRSVCVHRTSDPGCKFDDIEPVDLPKKYQW